MLYQKSAMLGHAEQKTGVLASRQENANGAEVPAIRDFYGRKCDLGEFP